ncbi:MAG TPA: D-alanine--D-alanine ligase [Candidatus Paceibacterota bacterium]|nr:D-alanine--D-alanine ligase [Candidatus Paceibacterota bacterium]
MEGTVVGVLRGGPSREHEVSLKSGATFLANLPEPRYTARDIYIDKAGEWHLFGRPISPERALRQVDVALLALHGDYGEDGEVQKLLERFGVPYAGADSFGSFIAMHKVLAKEKAKEVGLKTAEYYLVEDAARAAEAARQIIRRFAQPVVVKPVGWGSSIGVSIVGGYAPVHQAIEGLFVEGARSVLVEELIRGREVTVGVVENLRSDPLYVLPAVEIVPPEGDFFSYSAKYSGASREICPALLPRKVNDALAKAARAAHQALGLRHYSRSDFIVAPSGDVYYLETNTLPGMTSESLMPKALAAVGITIPLFLDHLVNLVLAR